MRGKPSKKATIIEVARRAGVSTATAGRVLGSYGYASEAIQKKVLAAAKALGYRPNRLARGFKTGKSQTIGVVAGDIESPFYASVLRGVADVARAKGFGVLVTNSDETEGLEREAVELLLEKRVDGLIVSPAAIEASGHLRAALEANCALVQVDRIVRGLETDTVVLDNIGAARDCIDRLLRAGHRRIAIVAELGTSSGMDPASFIKSSYRVADLRHFFPSWQRLAGYVEAHRAVGAPVDARLIRRVRAYSAAAAERETVDVLALGDAPTALFTADGVMSTGAMEAIATLGLRVPQDLSLVCFDDLDWMKFVGAGISAVAQPAYQMGSAVAELLLRRIEGEPGPRTHLVLPAQFLERASIRSLRRKGPGLSASAG
ncbi:MAG: LacI family DNA-binding transcriptional regulator [Hyphomicrobiales bacterium]|nr:LacI family DNA-binding transcriptional regulator [Hyphomicrobiales bacterium]